MEIVFDTERLLKKTKKKGERIEMTKRGPVIDIIRRPRRGRPARATLPIKIHIAPEVIGLIVGEGYIDEHRFIIANSEERVTKEILKFLSQFHHKAGLYVEVCTKGHVPEIKRKCKRSWEQSTGMSIRSVKEKKEFYNTTTAGTLHIELNNSIITRLLKFMIEKGKIQAEHNSRVSEGYMRGVFAGEGNINIKKADGCVYLLRISAKKKKDRSHFKRCLKLLGINVSCKDMPTVSKNEGLRRGWKTTKGRGGAILISRWENFVKAIDLGLFNLHPRKEKLFFSGFKKNKFTKQFLSFGGFRGKKFTQKEAQTQFRFKGRHIDRLNRLYNNGFAEREREGRKFVYNLTESYNILYEKISKQY